MAEKKEFLAFKFRVQKAEASGDTGYIEGFASTFGNVDQGGDVVMPGAFTRTLKNSGGHFPILLDHSPYKPAGYNREASETDKGLKVKGELKLFDPDVKQRYELMKLSLELNCPMGLSIGYSAVDYGFSDTQDEQGRPITVRLLKEIRLWEYSPVVFPMNEEAGVTAAKAQALEALFARLQNGRYDLEVIRKALDDLDRDAGQARPAAKETDPELLHSVDRLIALMKA